MLRVELPQSRYATLLQADITDEEARTLIDGRQQIDDILAIMVKAKLFSGTPEDNKHLFMSLIEGTKSLAVFGKTVMECIPPQNPDPNENKYNFCMGDNLDNLVLIYQLLGGAENRPCLLTANIHHALLEMVKVHSFFYLRNTNDLFNKLILLDGFQQPIVDNYFSDSDQCECLKRRLDSEDQTGKWMLYLLGHVNGKSDIQALANLLCPLHGGRGESIRSKRYSSKEAWLTYDTFKLLVQNASRLTNKAVFDEVRALISNYKNYPMAKQIFIHKLNTLLLPAKNEQSAFRLFFHRLLHSDASVPSDENEQRMKRQDQVNDKNINHPKV